MSILYGEPDMLNGDGNDNNMFSQHPLHSSQGSMNDLEGFPSSDGVHRDGLDQNCQPGEMPITLNNVGTQPANPAEPWYIPNPIFTQDGVAEHSMNVHGGRESPSWQLTESHSWQPEGLLQWHPSAGPSGHPTESISQQPEGPLQRQLPGSPGPHSMQIAVPTSGQASSHFSGASPSALDGTPLDEFFERGTTSTTLIMSPGARTTTVATSSHDPVLYELLHSQQRMMKDHTQMMTSMMQLLFQQQQEYKLQSERQFQQQHEANLQTREQLDELSRHQTTLTTIASDMCEVNNLPVRFTQDDMAALFFWLHIGVAEVLHDGSLNPYQFIHFDFHNCYIDCRVLATLMRTGVSQARDLFVHLDKHLPQSKVKPLFKLPTSLTDPNTKNTVYHNRLPKKHNAVFFLKWPFEQFKEFLKTHVDFVKLGAVNSEWSHLYRCHDAESLTNALTLSMPHLPPTQNVLFNSMVDKFPIASRPNRRPQALLVVIIRNAFQQLFQAFRQCHPKDKHMQPLTWKIQNIEKIPDLNTHYICPGGFLSQNGMGCLHQATASSSSFAPSSAIFGSSTPVTRSATPHAIRLEQRNLAKEVRSQEETKKPRRSGKEEVEDYTPTKKTKKTQFKANTTQPRKKAVNLDEPFTVAEAPGDLVLDNLGGPASFDNRSELASFDNLGGPTLFDKLRGPASLDNRSELALFDFDNLGGPTLLTTTHSIVIEIEDEEPYDQPQTQQAKSTAKKTPTNKRSKDDQENTRRAGKKNKSQAQGSVKRPVGRPPKKNKPTKASAAPATKRKQSPQNVSESKESEPAPLDHPTFTPDSPVKRRKFGGKSPRSQQKALEDAAGLRD